VTQYTSDLKSAAHKQLALDVAHESIVVVKNDKFGAETAPMLPLSKTTIKSVAFVGPYAYAPRLNGGGSGVNCPYYITSFVDAMTTNLGASKVLDSTQWKNADVVIACVGVSGEGEGADRTTAVLEPPSGQLSLVSAVLAANKKCIVVLTGGSAAVKDSWANAPAIIVAWYPGEEQGNALADIIFGDVNPSGRLSASWPASESQLPSWDASPTAIAYESPDTGRGQRYYDRCNLTPLFCFGHGLSYTTFQYSNLKLPPGQVYAGETVVVSVDIKNTGTVAGEEVAQLYVHENAPQLPRPVKELRGFARASLAPGETKTVSFTLREREFAYFDTRAKTTYTPYGRFIAQPDVYTIMVGPSAGNLPITGTLMLLSPWL
jgi:beta-glucosidase